MKTKTAINGLLFMAILQWSADQSMRTENLFMMEKM